jgi:hypothetical protein
MNEDALRAIVRETLARIESGGRGPRQPDAGAPLQWTSDPSHYQYALPPSDGPCLIEPAVQCNHCGYCQSHGH